VNAGPLDPKALLVALVLAPTTYSRNRFFQLYADPEVHRVRRRATQLRALVRELGSLDPSLRAAALDGIEEGPREAWLRYERPDVGLRRTFRLEALELSLVRFALSLRPEGPSSKEGLGLDAARVEEALARLGNFRAS
jgi:hypothetical protein